MLSVNHHVTRILVNIPGAKAAMQAFSEARKGDVVSEEKIMRRATICLSCPMKGRQPSATTLISQLLGRLANKHRVPTEISKSRCNACGCSFMLMLPSKTLHPDTPEQEALRPSNCWVLSPGKKANAAARELREAASRKSS